MTETTISEQLGIDNSDSIDWGETSLSDDFEVTDELVEPEEEVETEEEEEDEGEVADSEDDSEEADDEGEDDEDSTSEDDDEEVEGDDDSEASAKLQEVNNNLNAALQSERDKRKTFSEENAKLKQEIDLLRGNSSSEEYDALVAQIEELGLQDVLDVKKKQPIDPRVQELLDAQDAIRQKEEAAAKFNEFQSNMHTEVAAKVSGYKHIDTKDAAQGEALADMIVAGVAQGGELSAVVDKSLKLLDSLLGSTLKGRKAPVTPKRKVKAATKTTASAKQRTVKSKHANGNFDDVFANIAESFR